MSTISLFVAPLVATYELHETTKWSKIEMMVVIFIMFFPNGVGRVVGFKMPHEAKRLVSFGMASLVCGCAMWLMLKVFCPPQWWHSFAGGLLLQFGVGLVMPNAKILSLGRLPKAYSSTANSIVKLSQIPDLSKKQSGP